MEKKWVPREKGVENPPVIEGRVPPHDLEAEAAVLSACMLDLSAMDKITDLKPEYFYSEAHRRIFEACFELKQSGHPVDVLQVQSWLKDRQRLAQVGGAGYLDGRSSTRRPSSRTSARTAGPSTRSTASGRSSSPASASPRRGTSTTASRRHSSMAPSRPSTTSPVRRRSRASRSFSTS